MSLRGRGIDCPADGPVGELSEAWPRGSDEHGSTRARERAGAARDVECQVQLLGRKIPDAAARKVGAEREVTREVTARQAEPSSRR